MPRPDAEFLLGQMYEDAEGLPQDYVKAAEWYRVACEKRPDRGGAGQGCNNLGLLYLDGNGVRRDMIEAYKYFKIAGARRNVDFAKSRMRQRKLLRLNTKLSNGSRFIQTSSSVVGVISRLRSKPLNKR